MLVFPPFDTNNILSLSVIDSTNSFANKAIQEGQLKHGDIIHATHQTQGRGQRANSWYNEKDKDLLISMVLEPVQGTIKDTFLLNMAVCLAVRDYVATICADCTVKWSNDIYVGKQKIAGILIENSWRAEKWQHSIVGIGLNVNSTDHANNQLRATSMHQVSRNVFNISQVLNDLLVYLRHRIQQCTEKPNIVYEDYNSHLFLRGQWCNFLINGLKQHAKIMGVNKEGKIALRYAKRVQYFAYGEAKLIVE